MNKKIIWSIVIVIIVIIAFMYGFKNNHTGSIKIGIITDLSGPAAYWGESTKAGANILKKELEVQGRAVEFIFEDYGLDATKAASAAQKLANVDKVSAVYAEFNPGAIATASFLKDKEIPLIYAAAITSPLKDNNLFYKTYLDYREGCKQIAQKFKDQGVNKIGILKVNLEFGELCQDGVIEVYGESTISEGYNLGDVDFRTQLLKIKSAGAGAVINVGFEGDTANTLKIIKDLRYNLRYGTVDDTITENVLDTYKNELKDGWTFGFDDPNLEFQNKIKDQKVSSSYAAALAYTHLKQLVNAIDKCGNDGKCITKSLDLAPANQTIGFQKYNDRIADLIMKVKNY